MIDEIRKNVRVLRDLRGFPTLGTALAGILMVMAVGVAGCNIVVPVAYVIEGPGMIPAEYTLRETSTAVFIEDSENKLPRTALRGILGVEITQLLIENKVMSAGMFVDARDMIGLVRAMETSGRRASIERIGREAGVEQVIYVKIEGFALTLDGVTPRPTAVCSVKVLDLAAGTRVYPIDNKNGRETVGQLREVDPARFESFAKARLIEDELAVRLGRNVAQIFYEHDRVDLGENLGIR